MISCLPSLGLAAFAFFRAFVGGFSAVALMEARDRPAGAAQSPVQPLHPASPNTSVPGSLCLGREMKGNLCQERGRIPPVLVRGTGAFRRANSMSKWGLWITWSHRDVKALQGRLGRDLSTSQTPKFWEGNIHLKQPRCCCAKVLPLNSPSTPPWTLPSPSPFPPMGFLTPLFLVTSIPGPAPSSNSFLLLSAFCFLLLQSSSFLWVLPISTFSSLFLPV